MLQYVVPKNYIIIYIIQSAGLYRKGAISGLSPPPLGPALEKFYDILYSRMTENPWLEVTQCLIDPELIRPDHPAVQGLLCRVNLNIYIKSSKL